MDQNVPSQAPNKSGMKKPVSFLIILFIIVAVIVFALLLVKDKGATKRLGSNKTNGLSNEIDTDGDGIPDDIEVAEGSDPNDINSTPEPIAGNDPGDAGETETLADQTDSDGDGIPDDIEVAEGSDPNDINSTPEPIAGNDPEI